MTYRHFAIFGPFFAIVAFDMLAVSFQTPYNVVFEVPMVILADTTLPIDFWVVIVLLFSLFRHLLYGSVG
jgi:hypothetical protein